MMIEADRKARFQNALVLDTLVAIEDCRLRYQNTSNPLFAFKGLDQWFRLNHIRAADGDEAAAMPVWIATYLAIVARRIANLANRLDWRVAPEPYGKLPLTEEALRETRDRPRSLTTSSAMALLPQALGIVRDGWNAFERAWALTEKEVDEQMVDLFRFVGGKGEAEAFERVLDEHQELAEKLGGKPVVTDARSLRKRVAAARKARAGPKPGG